MTRLHASRALACVAAVALVGWHGVSRVEAQARPAPFTLPLYSRPAPGAEPSPNAEVFEQKAGDPIARVMHVQVPDVRVFLPPRAKATRTAIVILPGGAYSILAIDHEAWQVARWLTDIGVAAIVVKYRVSSTEPDRYHFPVPQLDARQAMRLVRQNAARWNIDPSRVGVMGFSAGGHLASTLLTLQDETLAGDVPDAPSISSTPNFGVLVYPVINLVESWGHRGSADNLLGRDASPERRRRYSTDLRVTDSTPPTFLVATQDDDVVPVQNAMAFFEAMTAHKVPGELHVWEKGGHGYGMLRDRPPVAQEWLPALARWMRGRGWLERK